MSVSISKLMLAARRINLLQARADLLDFDGFVGRVQMHEPNGAIARDDFESLGPGHCVGSWPSQSAEIARRRTKPSLS